MAGEINFGILNQNLPAEIAGSYYRGQEQQQQNALAKQQLSQAQMSTQVSGMQLEKMKREEAGLLQMQRTIAAQGGPTDLKVAARAMIDSGIPEHVMNGTALMQTLTRREDFRQLMGGGNQPTAPLAMPQAPILPMQESVAPLGPQTPAMPQAVAPRTPFVLPGAAAATLNAAPNALAPTPPTANALAPTANALAPVAPISGDEQIINQLRKQIAGAYSIGSPEALAYAKAREAELLEITKPQIVGRNVIRGGKVVLTVPPELTNEQIDYERAVKQGFSGSLIQYKREIEKNPDIVKEFLFAKTPEGGNYTGSLAKYKLDNAAAGAARATTTVNAFTPASEEAQKDYIKSTAVTRDALKNAPVILANIEEAKKLVPGAKGFMGAGGEPMLTAASFLNNRFGMSINTEGVTDATILRTRLFAGILENLKKLDSQPTALQQAALQEALGSLGTDPTALPRVLDTYGESLRTKVDLHNQEVTDAEKRGVKFPFKPQIALPSKVSFPPVTEGAIAYLKANPNTKTDFESKFGPGTASKILGR
jgi:hypothetical protein